MLAYVARRGTAEGPLFKFEDGRLLTKDRFVKGVREALSQAGVYASQYSVHSFSIGTRAGRKGLSSEKWESSAYLDSCEKN